MNIDKMNINKNQLFKIVLIVVIIIIAGSVIYRHEISLPRDQKAKENEELQKQEEEPEKQIPENVGGQSQPASQPASQSTTQSKSQSSELMKRVVLVTCSDSSVENKSSGIIAVSDASQKRWYIATNAHVTVVDTPEKRICTVGLPTSPNYSVSQYFSANVVSVNYNYPNVDGAFLLVENGLLGFRHLTNEIIPICQKEDVAIGDKVNLYGYPPFGNPTLKMTEGFVNGIETSQYGLFYKTSAIIDSGNSGGLAVDVSAKCALGMSTLALEGTFKGIGYIQSWDMIKTSGNF